ncbi:hypothetical protein [Clostridium sp. KNHs205]|uniref:hypothetical protein n=1 Tax=Clostridium sp. KNHs205 TaxID=1449050 RepID=UPI00051C4875|nr:hypothetical protein [Clostridium sp. KNHs205]
MGKYTPIKLLSFIRACYIGIIGSEFFGILSNFIMTLLITLHTLEYKDNHKWWTKLWLLIIVSLFIVIIEQVAKHLKNKSNTLYQLLEDAYISQKNLNTTIATKTYRLNKEINNVLRKKVNRNIDQLKNIADFQTLSFEICLKIYSLLSYHSGINDIQVTIFQRFNEKNNGQFVKMIAYYNKDTAIPPSSYYTTFPLFSKEKEKSPLFTTIFEDANSKHILLHNKKLVKENFVLLNGSEKREEEICQYIGIPIKTNRNIVELVLQVDISGGKFARTNKQLKIFSDTVLCPYANLIHSCYERDFVFDKLYKLLEKHS